MLQISKIRNSKELESDSIILESANNIYQSLTTRSVFVDGVVKDFSERSGDYLKTRAYTGRSNNSRHKKGGSRHSFLAFKIKDK